MTFGPPITDGPVFDFVISIRRLLAKPIVVADHLADYQIFNR